MVSSKACTFEEFDVFIVYFPQGIHMPNVSILPYTIPTCNFYKRQNLRLYLNFLMLISLNMGP